MPVARAHVELDILQDHNGNPSSEGALPPQLE